MSLAMAEPGTRRGRRWSRIFVAALAVGLSVAVGSVSLRTTLAVFGATATTKGTWTAATLHPPTALAAAAGATVTLTWTPTVDPVATGYYVFRSTTSGSGYSQISTVTPKTVATATNTPAASGVYYYVLQTEFQNWTSTTSNEASALFLLPAVTTATVPCLAGLNLAEAGGDNNGYQTRPNSACDLGANFAADGNTGSAGHSSVCTNAANDREQFWGFNLGLPGSIYQVNSITVRADARRTSNAAGTNNLCIQLSWDGGTSWSNVQSVAITSAAFATYTIGGAVAGWGAHAWTLANLTSPNFRMRVYDATDVATQSYRLDYLAVTVNYNP
ncbi:MAG TPA: hypothetical protein VF323_00030 [Candidatus Limnocylindrales bacterium]